MASPVVSALSRERLQRRSARFSVEEPDVFDTRFSNLWEVARRHQGVTSERSAELLNWRYEKTGPVEARGKYSVFALVEGGDVAGYVVYRLGDGARLVYDIQILPERRVIDALLAEFILDARDKKATAIDLGLGRAGHPADAAAARVRVPAAAGAERTAGVRRRGGPRSG